MSMWKLPLVFTLCLFLSVSVYADEKSEIETLREEIKALRSEVTALRKERDELKAKLIKPGKDKDSSPEGALNGIQWEISAMNDKGVAMRSTTFYAQDGKEIGTYSDAGNKARMDVTKTGSPRFNGTYNLLRVKNDPPTYSGTFKNQQGQEVRVILRALVD